MANVNKQISGVLVLENNSASSRKADKAEKTSKKQEAGNLVGVVINDVAERSRSTGSKRNVIAQATRSSRSAAPAMPRSPAPERNIAENRRSTSQNAAPASAPTPAVPAASPAGASAPTGVVSTVTQKYEPVVRASAHNMSEAQKFEHYKAMIERSGGTFNPNGPNVIGVRTPTNGKGNGGAYDDTMAVIWRDKQGGMHVREFRGNTEPNGTYEGRMGQDVNGDGSRDQGRMRTGHYQFTATTFKGNNALRMIGDSRVDRDTNHDGVFGNDGGAASGGGASMLFHGGGANSTNSAGCQTLPPGEFDQFMSTLREAGGTSNVRYTLTNA
jgi:hypothetical protein